MFTGHFPPSYLAILTWAKIIYKIRKSVHAIRDLSALHQNEGECSVLVQSLEYWY